MANYPQSLNIRRIVGLLLLAWFVAPWLGAALAADPDSTKTDYENWISKYAKKALVGGSLGMRNPLKLVVKVVTGDDIEVPEPRQLNTREIVDETEVAMDGEFTSVRITSMAIHGGGRQILAETAMIRLNELLPALPEDHGRLPPLGRRVLLQVAAGDGFVTRVYDRANLPVKVLEVLRLSECRVSAWVPEFKPQGEITVAGSAVGGFFCVSPDGRQLLFMEPNKPLQFWDSTSHELLREVRGLGNKGIAFSPDGAQAVVSDSGDSEVVDLKTWKYVRKQIPSYSSKFTPDGRYALLQVDKHPLRIYDAHTWKQVEQLPEVPQDAVIYVPASKSKRAVVQSQAGTVFLWDTVEHRKIAALGENLQLLEAAFSPDENSVAVKTRRTADGWAEARFGIWRVDDGQSVQELHPVKITGNERSTGLLWTPDGKYVLAGVVPSWASDQEIGLFEAKTGRQWGKFTGCLRILGIALLPDTGQLVAGCDDGKIRFWDFLEARKKIREFEESLVQSE